MLKNMDFVSSLFPFSGMTDENIAKIFSELKYEIRSYSKNETVFSPSESKCEIGFIVNGECIVSRMKPTCEEIPLNTLTPHQSFGILRVFDHDGDFPTKIVASKNSTILFIDGNDFKALTETNIQVAKRVIPFLIKRISFLNSKVETFSGSNTSEKLASYLLAKYNALGPEFSISKTAISAEINVGRASLYRDLEAFQTKGLINFEGKKIIIICPEGLERIIK